MKTKTHGITQTGVRFLAKWMNKLGQAMQQYGEDIPVEDWIHAFTEVNAYEKQHGTMLTPSQSKKMAENLIKQKKNARWAAKKNQPFDDNPHSSGVATAADEASRTVTNIKTLSV